jgi:anaerobic selenocysteine-containing dehydrogenase
MMVQHFRTCTLCEAMCGVVIESEAGRVKSIRGDAQDPFSRGHVCAKVMALQDVYEDADRLRVPMRRDGSRFVPIAWGEALDFAADGLARVQRAHGRDAVAVYQGNPTLHNFGALSFAPLFVRSIGTRNNYSASSIDQLPHMLAAYCMFGHQLLLPVPDIDRTDYMLMLGANPVVSHGSLMSAGDYRGRLRALLARGGRLVVIDPRRSETAELASAHHFIRPGSDALLLLAMLDTLFRERRVELGRLAALSSGLAELERLAARFPAERVAQAVGLPAASIAALAREFAAAPRAVCYGRLGVSAQEFGSLACYLINALNIVTGNFDRQGGAMFTRPAVDPIGMSAAMASPGSFAAYHSRVRGLPEFAGELPTAVMAEEMETEGEGQIRGLLPLAGNPVLSAPSGARLERAIQKLDFRVAIDFYVNETTRHADVILPPTTALEQDHYDLAVNVVAVRNTAKYSAPTFAAAPGALADWQIMNELAWRMARGRFARAAARVQAQVLARLGPRGLLRILLQLGPYGRRSPFRPGLDLRALEQNPHGVDLGPLQPCLPARLRTRDRKIALAPAALVADAERLERKLSGGAHAAALLLIGRRHARSKNSWLRNSPRLVKGPQRCTLQMHPEDAQQRGLLAGASVQVSSRVGSIVLPLEVTDSLMQGVVSIPHGFGQARDGVQLRVAMAQPGASANDITDDAFLDALSGNAGFNGVPVRVTGVNPGEPQR